MDFLTGLGVTGIIFLLFVVFGFFAMVAKFYRKVEQGQALVRNGIGGTKVSFSGSIVIPILHMAELMDISVNRVIIDRQGGEGLICKDNMRADIKVVFFVRVNKTEEDVLKVAQSVGCRRASDPKALQELFEAKFSEALKTVGKHFDFSDLYTSRDQFKEEILKVIGTDLNGYVMDDAAIDFLEQTPITKLDPDNIMDSEGIKRITQLTSDQKILANQIDREREKTMTRQDVEAKDAILELERQRAEAENRQKREVAAIQAREDAETKKIQEEERLKGERARITADEEINVADENKERQIIVARKNKERTEAVESERLEKDRMLEATERERIVELSRIEKDKAVEMEKKNISEVIRERVRVEKTVVEEQERMKDTQAFAGAEREKKVALIQAEKSAEEALVLDVKAAEASRQVAELRAAEDMLTSLNAAEAEKKSAEFRAEQTAIEAEAYYTRAQKESAAQKLLAEAAAAEKAAEGLAEVQVMEARAVAIEKEGSAKARVESLHFRAEAEGIEGKANAMKLLDAAGREHEEFKIRLEKSTTVELAEIEIRKEVARYQADVMAQALKSAKIDIIGGETVFFDKVVSAVMAGKTVDRFIDSSKNLSDVKETFFNADPEFFKSQLRRFVNQFGLNTEDIRNLSVSALLSKMLGMAKNPEDKGMLYELLAIAEKTGMMKKMAVRKESPEE
ncbi:MAG: hypothetical protein V2I97_11040 [Desulfococcaceae bacterium]|jgi:uncharacterized membrane protein YqiK|nr:hypothetical protein [Desulfococcaceae bacterium]